MIQVGIVGGTGYIAGELIRVLSAHPEVRLSWVTSRSSEPVSFHHPNLFGTALHFCGMDSISEFDLAFLCVPHESALPVADKFLAAGKKVIDLGHSFRIRDHLESTVSSFSDSSKELALGRAYGMPELHLSEIAKAKLIANPGCLASACIYSMLPLISNNLVDLKHLVFCGMTGTSGLGVEPRRQSHHPEIANNLIPYNVINHRHCGEIEQELSLVAGRKVQVHFTPIYAPIVRGILGVSYAFPLSKTKLSDLYELFCDYYKDSPFVHVHKSSVDDSAWRYKPYPWVSSIVGTNNCLIGIDFDESRERIAIVTVLDNLGKGGAQASVENFNIMYGFPRKTGIPLLASRP